MNWRDFVPEKQFLVMDVNNVLHVLQHHALKPAALFPESFLSSPRMKSEEEIRDRKKASLLTSFFRSILFHHNLFDADHVVLSFDSRSWRNDVYPDYKKTRKERILTPVEEQNREITREVIETVFEFFSEETSVTVLRVENAETDDIIARWAAISGRGVFRNIIMSTDHDFLQIVNRHNFIFTSTRNRLFVPGHKLIMSSRASSSDITIPRINTKWEIEDKFDSRYELFVKCIRGDRSDNIPSAYPRVREKRIREVYEGDHVALNNFMNETFRREGKEYVVGECFEFNRSLIDLTRQPSEIKERIDDAIAKALDKKRRNLVGLRLSKFCRKHNLQKVANDLEKYGSMFSSPISSIVG